MIFFLLIWSLGNVAFFALASAMTKHQKQIYGKELTAQQTKIAKAIGWIVLILALILCLQNGQWSNMVSYWVLVLSFSAVAMGLVLSYLEQKAKIFSVLSMALSAISLLLYLI